MELDKIELVNITGGASKFGIAGIAACIFTFLVGVVDGYLRPHKCL